MVDVELLVRPEPGEEHAEGGEVRPPMVASLSPSSMATWRQCPKRFWFEKILRLPVEASEPAVCGSFVHLVLEQLMGRQPGGRTEQTARGIAGEVWPAFVADPESRFTELALDAAATRAFKQRAWAGITGYFRIEDPNRVEVVGTEREIRAELEGAPVYGIIDRIDQGGDGLVVTDYKSGKAPAWDDEREEKLGQLRTYAALLEATGERVTELRLLFVSPQLAAGARAERCVAAAAVAEETVAGLVGGLDEALAGIREVEAAIADARAAAQGGRDGAQKTAPASRPAAASTDVDPVVDGPTGPDAVRAAARAAGEEAAGRIAAQMASPPGADTLAASLLEAVAARRRAYFAERSFARARPTTVSLRVREVDLEQARREASTIWSEASACYEAWDFPGRTGTLCDWCPFADRCEAFATWDAAGRPAA